MARKRPSAPQNVHETSHVTRVAFDAAELVTLENGDEGPPNAFAQLRPAADATPEHIEQWRKKVATRARAVRVLPAPKSSIVPTVNRFTVGTLGPRGEVLRALEGANLEPDVRIAVESLIEDLMSKVGL